MDFSDFVVEYGLYAGYILMIVAALAAIVLPLINAISNPKSLIKGVVGIVFLGVIFIIGYALAGSEVTQAYITQGVTESSASKLIGGALITMYILVAIAIVGIVFTEIVKLVK
ncbi:MAG: hypothetical protein ACNS62_24465 [Candidatus Cyclobacteriaceae bacterium M3_2C_046]